MHDLAFVRANLPLVEEKLRQRGVDPTLLADFAALDAGRRAAITEAETLKAQRNALSAEFGRLKREGKDVSAIGQETSSLKERTEALEAAAAAADQRARQRLREDVGRAHAVRLSGEGPHCAGRAAWHPGL
jgi:seryl-tRNA synthetase